MWRLMQLTGANKGRTVEVSSTLSVGRAPTNGVVLPDPRVSRDQGSFEVRENQLVFTARPNAAPCFFNGVQATEGVLNPGDVLHIADVEFQVQGEFADERGTREVTMMGMRMPISAQAVPEDPVDAKEVEPADLPPKGPSRTKLVVVFVAIVVLAGLLVLFLMHGQSSTPPKGQSPHAAAP